MSKFEVVTLRSWSLGRWLWDDAGIMLVILVAFLVTVVGFVGWYVDGIQTETITVQSIQGECGNARADCVLIATDGRIFLVRDDSWAVMRPGETYVVVVHEHTTGDYPSVGEAKAA